MGAPEPEAEWPDEGDEAAFLSESRPQAEVELSPRQPASSAERLPDLDDLVARIPPGVVGLLDDLFRAKFTTVRKFANAEAPAQSAGPGNP